MSNMKHKCIFLNMNVIEISELSEIVRFFRDFRADFQKFSFVFHGKDETIQV